MDHENTTPDLAIKVRSGCIIRPRPNDPQYGPGETVHALDSAEAKQLIAHGFAVKVV